MKLFYKYYLPIVVWLAIIFEVPTATHASGITGLPYHIDKAAHFFLYGVLGFLVVRAIYFRDKIPDMKQAILVAVGIAVFCAGLDELHQIYMPGRFSSFFDFVFDILGITASQIVFWYVIQRKSVQG